MAAQLERLVTGAHRRATLVGMLHFGGVGAVLGAAIGVLMLVIAWTLGRFAIAVPIPLAGATAMIGIGIVAGAVWALLHRPARLAVAVQLDRTLGLRDRLGTAESLRATARRDADIAGLVLADAERHSLGLSPKVAFPLRGGAWWLGALVLGAVVVGGGWFLPPPAIAARTITASGTPDPLLREESKSTVDEVLREIRERPALPPDVGGDTLAMLDAIAEQLERDEQSPEELQAARDRAAAAISGLGDELAERAQREQNALDEMAAEFSSLVGDEPAPPDLAPFVDALREGRLDDAADALAALRSRLDELTLDDRAALAEFFDRLADDVAAESQADATGESSADSLTDVDPRDPSQEPTTLESDDRDSAAESETTDPRQDRSETATENDAKARTETEGGTERETETGDDAAQRDGARPDGASESRDAEGPDPDAAREAGRAEEGSRPETGGETDPSAQGDAPDGDPAGEDGPNGEGPDDAGANGDGAEESAGEREQRQRAMEDALREMAECMRDGACESGQPAAGEDGAGQGEGGGGQAGEGASSEPDSEAQGDPQAHRSAEPGDGRDAADGAGDRGADETQERASDPDGEGDAQPTGAPAGDDADAAAAGDRGSDPSLERILRDMADSRRSTEERLEQSRRLREQAERLAERATPEERERLRRWSDLAQRERADDDARGGRSDRPDVAPDDRSARRSPPAPHDGPEIDLTEAGGTASVLAELLGGEPSEGGRSALPPPAARAIREAAERGVEPGELPARYHRLIRRYFGRLEETATEARDQSPGRTP